MNPPHERNLDSYFAELVVVLACLAANLDLLSYLVKGVLSGEDSGLTERDDEFADDLSDVMCRAAIEVLDTLGVLQEYVTASNRDQAIRFVPYSQSYQELHHRWTALTEAVNEIWKSHGTDQGRIHHGWMNHKSAFHSIGLARRCISPGQQRTVRFHDGWQANERPTAARISIEMKTVSLVQDLKTRPASACWSNLMEI